MKNVLLAWSRRSLPAALLAGFAVGAAAADVADTATAIVEATNAFRKEQGLEALRGDGTLQDTAREFARYMAETGRYGHTADGRQPSERASAQGYDYCIVAENIAYRYRSTGYDDAAALGRDFVQGWKESPGHRENMVEPAVTQTGVGVAQGEGGRYFAVQLFGRPRDAAIRFRVENGTGQRVGYRVEEREFSLRPREIGAHQVCRSVEIAVTSPGAEGAATVRAEDGGRYTVLEDRVAEGPAPRR